MQPPRILLLTSCLPLPYEVHGGAQRTSHLLRALQKIGQVDMALVGISPESYPASENAKTAGLPIVACFPRPYALQCRSKVPGWIPLIGKPWNAIGSLEGSLRPDLEISTWLQLQLKAVSYDLIVSRFLRPGVLASIARNSGLPLMLDWDDVDYLKLRSQFAANPWSGVRGRFAMNLALARMTRLCNSQLKHFAHVWLASPAHLLALKPTSYSSLPNVAWRSSVTRACDSAEGALQLLFVGNLGYPPNAQALTRFILRIWPIIREQVPLARFSVVGRLPAGRVPQQWISDGVNLLGEVPELDVYYANSTASVCPVEWGGGSNVKAIESLTHGVPCVGTPHTCEPFREHIGPADGLLCGETDAAFADACIRLLSDSVHRAQLSEAALKVVSRRYTPEAFDEQVAADVGRILAISESSLRNDVRINGGE